MSSIDAAVVVDVTRLQRVFCPASVCGQWKKTGPQCGIQPVVIVRNGV